MERRVLPPLAVTVAALLLLQVFSISPGAATPRRFQIGSKQQERPEPEPIEEWAVCSTADGPGFISRIEAKFGLTYCGPVGHMDGCHCFRMEKEDPGLLQDKVMTALLQNENQVYIAEQQVGQVYEKHGYVPPSDPLWTDQWSLLNTGQFEAVSEGKDLNVEPVWLQGITGCNVTVGVIDEGTDYTHPDLMANVDLSLSYDYFSDDMDPFPDGFFEGSHGTSTSGEIVMSKDNGVCGVGAAYKSTVASLRLIVGSITDTQIANSLSHLMNDIEIYSNSWGPASDGDVVLGPGTFTRMAIEAAVANGRNGKGNIYVFSSGNGGLDDDDCNSNGYANSIYTIAIGSAARDGSQAYYDEDCACKMAVTLVSSNDDSNLVVTTNNNGACTTSFDGTSAACPLASATFALALEANPDLTWRDMQYLVVYTSRYDILDEAGEENGVGLTFSHGAGFGALDAEALVTRARNWISVPDQLNKPGDPSQTSGSATSSDPLFISIECGDSSVTFLEHVVATMTVGTVDGRRGDIRIELTSPSNTLSVLMDFRSNDVSSGSFQEWPFMSVHYWGEDPSGTWNLTIIYQGTGSADLTDLELKFYGTAQVPDAVAQIPAQCDPACKRGCSGPGPEHCDACNGLRNAETLECISSCPSGFTERNNYCHDASLPEPTCGRPNNTIELNITECNPGPGSCVDAGIEDCCTGGICFVATCNSTLCYCDSACYSFGDCCDDIAEICEETTPTPTPTPSPSPTPPEPDPIVVYFEETYYEVSEGDASNLALLVCLRTNYTESFSVYVYGYGITAYYGSDFRLLTNNGYLEFNPGDERMCACFEIVQDDCVEGNETFAVFVQYSYPYNIIVENYAIVNILDDDDSVQARIVSYDEFYYYYYGYYYYLGYENIPWSNNISVSEDYYYARFVVLVTGCSQRDIQYVVNGTNGTALEGEDFYAFSTTLYSYNFYGFYYNDFYVVIIDDKIMESEESFTLTLTSDDPAVEIVGGPFTVSIVDNDEPVVVYFDPAYQFVSEGAGSDNLAVLVCAVVNYTECYISFNVSAYGITAYYGSDFKLSSSDVLSFYPYYYGEQRQCICIEIIDDYCVEYNETFRVELIPVEDSGATVIMENYTLVTIEDDDTIQARIISYNEFIADVPISNLSSSIYVNENVGEICLVVLFTGCSERQLNVTLFTADGTALDNEDYTATSIEVSTPYYGFYYSYYVKISIEILNDDNSEPVELFTVMLTSDDPSVQIAGGPFTVFISDDGNDVEDLSITIKGDTPRLESNVMTVEFDTGGSVVSATCSVLNMNQDCISGTATFDLPANRRRVYTLTIETVGASSATFSIQREFHTNSIPICHVHLINQGIVTDGDSVTIEWVETGPGGLSSSCNSLEQPDTFAPCTSPFQQSGLDPGVYSLTVRPVGDECTRRVRTTFNFEIQ